MISVIIATKNRPEQLLLCLQSILKNTWKNYEVIIVDQSNTDKTKMLIQNIRLQADNRRITYIYNPGKGLSKSRNIGISKARGEICAFTDDDCISSPSWLHQIQQNLNKYPHVGAVFGSSYPYTRTKNPHTRCPSTFTKTKRRFITRFGYHVSDIGFGNNMAIRTSIIQTIGGFKPWLAVGSLSPAAEDAEIELRMLAYGNILMYEPTIRIYHNRWLTPQELRQLSMSYNRGESTCYAYYHFQGYRFAKRILTRGILRYTKIVGASLLKCIHSPLRRRTLGSLYWSVGSLMSYVAGICLGYFFAHTDPHSKHTRFVTVIPIQR